MRNEHVVGWLVAGLVSLGIAPGRVGASLEGGTSAPPTTAPGEPSPDASLDDLVHLAEERSPALRSARADHLAARESLALAASFPDPRVAVNLAVEPVETRVGPQRGQVVLSQTLPGVGKRSARAEAARADVAAAAAMVESLRQRLAYDVADAYLECYFLERSLEVTRDNRDLLVYLEEVVRTQYETGKASYADLIREQVEIGRLENDLRSLEDRLHPARARLNGLLHRPPEAALPGPRVDPAGLALRPEDEIVAMVTARSPELVVAEARVAQRAQAESLAAVEERADWTLSLGYMPTGPARMPGVPGSGDDPLMVGVVVNVPLWRGKNRAAVRQAEARHEAALEARSATEDGLETSVSGALYDFRNAEREVDLYRNTLLPKAMQSLEASQSGLRAGTAGVLDVVDAQRMLLSFQLAYERALTSRARAVARLRFLAGGEVLREGAPADEGGA